MHMNATVTLAFFFMHVKLNIFSQGPQTMSVTSLQKKLARLPQPKNNFEISMPDEAELDATEQAEASDSSAEGTSAHVADQAEVDREAAEARKAAADAAWAKRSQALRRGLPRPTAVNNAVLRPPPSTPAEELSLTDLQKVIVFPHISGCQLLSLAFVINARFNVSWYRYFAKYGVFVDYSSHWFLNQFSRQRCLEKNLALLMNLTFKASILPA